MYTNIYIYHYISNYAQWQNIIIHNKQHQHISLYVNYSNYGYKHASNSKTLCQLYLIVGIWYSVKTLKVAKLISNIQKIKKQLLKAVNITIKQKTYKQQYFFCNVPLTERGKGIIFLMYDSSFEIRTQNNIAENQKLKANKGLF